jgi:SAM-dependent methyltransferase
MVKQTKNPSIEIYSRENSLKWNSNGGCDDTARPWIVQRIKELAREGKKTLLDVGSGTGRWTRQFASTLEKVTGLDISPEMVKIARESGAENILYLEGNILEAKLGKYDVVTALAMLQHTRSREELNQVYEKIRSCLNDCGHFIFYTPHPMCIFGKTRIATCEFDLNSSYDQNFNYKADISMQDGSTRNGSGFHHSIEEYIGDLVNQGFVIKQMKEFISEGDKIPSALVVDAVKIKEMKGGNE